MKKYSKETAVGLFVLVGLICVAYLSVKLGNVQLFADSHYELTAEFSDISGLKVNSPVQVYGVDVGYVKGIELDQKNGMARVILKVENQVKLTDAAIASVKTSGLIGDKYIKITPGGVGDPLEPGDAIFDTESAIDLEALISKYVFGEVK